MIGPSFKLSFKPSTFSPFAYSYQTLDFVAKYHEEKPQRLKAGRNGTHKENYPFSEVLLLNFLVSVGR